MLRFQPPLHQLPAAPEASLKEKPLVVEKSWCDQPERSKRTDDVIGIVLRIIDVSVMLKVHPSENGKLNPSKQR
jgi:hypothetical protein